MRAFNKKTHSLIKKAISSVVALILVLGLIGVNQFQVLASGCPHSSTGDECYR